MEPAIERHPDLPPPVDSISAKLNWLRAGVLGANDGIVSTAALMVGVAAANSGIGPTLTAGIAGLCAGACSMAVGEYVSVSSQRDSEKAVIRREQSDLEADPNGQEAQLAHMYEQRGLSPATAHAVARELTNKDPLTAHLDIEFRLDENELNNPWAAAAASAIAFTAGSLFPLLTAAFTPHAWMPWSIVVAVMVALLVTGFISARIGGAGKRKSMVRVLIGGLLALTATHFIGQLFGTSLT